MKGCGSFATNHRLLRAVVLLFFLLKSVVVNYLHRLRLVLPAWTAKNSDSRAESKAQPDFIVLGQELIHALADMDGVSIPDSRGKKANTYTSSTGEKVTEWVSLEELTTHGIGSYGTRYNAPRTSYPTENALRREQNLPVRVAYEIIPGQLKKRN